MLIAAFQMIADISIHAPREGGDAEDGAAAGLRADFNPRPPRGGRPRYTSHELVPQLFQSTPPARGATPIGPRDMGHIVISIHAPREGGDPYRAKRHGAHRDFNPRPPRGGRPLSGQETWGTS